MSASSRRLLQLSPLPSSSETPSTPEDSCPSMHSTSSAVLTPRVRVSCTAMMQLVHTISSPTVFRAQEVNWELPFSITNSMATTTLSKFFLIASRLSRTQPRISLTPLQKEIYTLVMESSSLPSMLWESELQEKQLEETELNQFYNILFYISF